MFWLGLILGAVLFIPAIYLVTVVWEWLKGPQFPIGRNRAIHNFKRDTNPKKTLAFLDEVGFKTKHLWGTWYYVKRVYFVKDEAKRRALAEYEAAVRKPPVTAKSPDPNEPLD